MAKLIIGIVGRQGSGKGTVAKILESKFGAQVFRFSAILGNILDQLNVDRSRDNLIKISEAVRGAFGQDVLAYALEHQATNADADIVVVDGIRRPEDIVALEPRPEFKIINVFAPTELRFARLKNRGEKVGEAHMTWEEFMNVETKASTEITIPIVEARATVTIDNSGTMQELEQKVVDLVHQL